jgi:hypothetical protein
MPAQGVGMRIVYWFTLATTLTGCGGLISEPQSVGERNSGFTYIPLDPLPVFETAGPSCPGDSIAKLQPGYRLRTVLNSLPDNAVRVAVKEYDFKGKIAYGPASVGEEGKRYQVILDYINVDTSNIRFYLSFTVQGLGTPHAVVSVEEVNRIQGYVEPAALQGKPREFIERTNGNIVIPVYVGVGLRLTADLQVIRGSINLSSLGALAAGVEAGKASGSLVVQTLGVTGRQVSTSLPLPSELNQTTVQNAILALGSIKAIINDEQNTVITPRVTGIYLPVRHGSEELVNRIVSELAREAIPWERSCDRVLTQ